MITIAKNELFEHTTECICAYLTDGTMAHSNRAVRGLFKYSEDEFSKINIADLYQNQSEYKRVTSILLESGSFRGVVRNRSKNGDEFVCFLSASQILDSKNEVIGFVKISYLIESDTDEKRNENLTNMFSHEKLATLLGSISSGIAISEPNGYLSWCNSKYEDITGDMQASVIGKNLLERFQVPHFALEEFVRSVQEGRGDSSFEFPFYKLNVGLRWMRVQTSILNYRSKDYIIELHSDITDLKMNSIQLMEAQERFEMITDSIENVFFLYDFVSQSYEYISPNSEVVFGLKPDYFYEDSASIKDYIAPENHSLLDDIRMKLMNGEPYDVEFKLFNQKEYIWVNEKGYPIQGVDGKTIKMSGVCTDITEKKRLEELLEKRRRDREESIQYSRLIQKATVPSVDHLKKLFKDCFIYLEPKGVLTGDFYLAERIRGENGNTYWGVALGDCTGHGVPGAILSILCAGLLKQTFFKPNINSPSEALEDVRNELNSVLNNNPNQSVNDGMDAGFAVFNNDFSEVTFSGARFNLYILRKEEWIIVKGDRFFVGYEQNEEPFTNQTTRLEKNDRIFMFSDGLIDQFGGAEDKKYLRRNLLNFLAHKAKRMDMSELGDAVKEEFETWKGDNEQTDDVCVFGMRVV